MAPDITRYKSELKITLELKIFDVEKSAVYESRMMLIVPDGLENIEHGKILNEEYHKADLSSCTMQLSKVPMQVHCVPACVRHFQEVVH